MSFLQRVVSQVHSTALAIPVARPKGLLAGALLSAVGSPIGQAEPAPPAPMRWAPPPARAQAVDPAPVRMARREPDAPPSTLSAAPKPAPGAGTSSQNQLAADTPLVVDAQAPPPPTAAQESRSPTESAQTMPPEAKPPGGNVPVADPALPDAPEPQPPNRPILELAEPHDDAGAPAGAPGPKLEGPIEPPRVATQLPGDARTTQIAAPTSDGREGVFGAPAPQPSEWAPMLEPDRPTLANRQIEKADGGVVEVVPTAQPMPLRSTPRLPAESALSSRSLIEAKAPLLHIDQIDVVVTDPTPIPTAPASRSPLAAVSANRRYLRRL